MFHPLSLYVGLRYVRARTHKFFVSFITWVSLTGVCVGVAALIVILSVMNGFEGELRDRLLALASDARIVASHGAAEPSLAEWRAVAQRVRAVPGVKGVAPYLDAQALAVRAPEMVGVTLRGIDPAEEGAASELPHLLKMGSLDDLAPGSNRALVGAVIAGQLGLDIGSRLTLLLPTVAADGTPQPKLRELGVAGVFEAGLEEHDASLIFVNFDDVRALGAAPSGEGLHVRMSDPLAAPLIAPRIRAVLPRGLEVIDWTVDDASYFRAIRIEKTMMSLILLLIVAVAAFNIVAMLVMVVNDKRTDIAILRTLGASPRRVMGVFITQGLVIGWVGVGLGVLLGLLMALHVTSIVPWLEHTFRFQIMDPDVYYITAIPSDVHRSNVIAIALAALALTACATVYPALRAARTPPADALRYE
ncbi:MAG TPA: lipoprotein-releasing ABC transporter permease subunit [Steroidobacteraceae bacterium]|nr:lipoprotein-releasing ABC transporter permease subunit [Steroidobacteraceae bacterium]